MASPLTGRSLVWLLLAGCGRGLPTEPPPKSEPRCQDDGHAVTCLRQQYSLASRKVQWQVPAGDAPLKGWPAVVEFHGSFSTTGPHWEANDTQKYGAYRLAQTTRALLERGYAVITPESLNGGNWFWNTNVVGYADNWGIAPDAQMMSELFEAIGQGQFGPIDSGRLYATGLSSGGFMTSRMAVSYPGKFRALAVHSASFAKCSVTCSVPELPADHPPTLLLHGEKDSVVPISTMRAYEGQLKTQALEVATEVSTEAGHEWLTTAVTRIPQWFDEHP